MVFEQHGWQLAALFLVCLFFVVLITRWGELTSLLKNRAPVYGAPGNLIIALLSRTRILLLRLSGASDSEISDDRENFLEAQKIQETYFLKYPGRVGWQLFSYYMVYCFILVLLAKPIDVQQSIELGKLTSFTLNASGREQVIYICILAATNVVTDVISLAITYTHLTKIVQSTKINKNFEAALLAFKDMICAALLFILSQLISNVLYPLSIETPPENYNPISIEAALMPYAFVQDATYTNVDFYNFIFPGQLFITGTVFVPTILVMGFIFSLGMIASILNLIYTLQAKLLNNKYPELNLTLQAPAEFSMNTPPVRIIKCVSFAVNSICAIFLSLIANLIWVLFEPLFFSPLGQ